MREKALTLHQRYKGKLSVDVKVPIRNGDDLSLIYSPGVSEPCKEIFNRPEDIYEYTIKGNLVGIVTNGSAVLGLGDIGAGAAMPVMEGKAALFKMFAGIDAFPICLNADDVDEFVDNVKRLQPTFGGINLEDIAAPNCFLIEERLQNEMDIPVFHDDQHGTAIVTAAGLINALKVVDKKLEEVKVVVNGAGAAGIAITKLLRRMGVRKLMICDSNGLIYKGRGAGMNPVKEEIAEYTNMERVTGSLADAVGGADVFVGVSAAGALTPDMVRAMNRDAVIFAMANPVPEIMPDEGKAAGAAVIGTGRSDLPNQMNNVLAFPGIFKGALQAAATEINEDMKTAAVYAIADLIQADELHADGVIPNPMDQRGVASVASEVAKAARESGVARNMTIPEGESL